MNTRSIQNALIELGFTFRKTDEEHPEWLCVDQDNIPVCSGAYLGPLVWRVSDELGGVV